MPQRMATTVGHRPSVRRPVQANKSRQISSRIAHSQYRLCPGLLRDAAVVKFQFESHTLAAPDAVGGVAAKLNSTSFLQLTQTSKYAIAHFPHYGQHGGQRGGPR